MFFTKYFSENSEGTSTITIRTGTEHEETIAVRRKFIHPWYYRGGATYYNDIALLELGNRICQGVIHKLCSSFFQNFDPSLPPSSLT